MLDLPLSKYLDAIFYQPGPPAENLTAPRSADAFAAAGITPAPNDGEPPDRVPMMRYPWSDAVNALHALPPADDGSRRLRYINPLTGGPVMPTLDCYLWQISGGPPYRSVSHYQ